MMVISVCVNDAVLLLYMLLFKSSFGSSCDSHHLLLLVVISVLQTYFSTSIGWYINIISVNEITVFNCKFKLKKEKILDIYNVNNCMCSVPLRNASHDAGKAGLACRNTSFTARLHRACKH